MAVPVGVSVTVVASVDEALNVATKERERIVPVVPSVIELKPERVNVTVLADVVVAEASDVHELDPVALFALIR